VFAPFIPAGAAFYGSTTHKFDIPFPFLLDSGLSLVLEMISEQLAAHSIGPSVGYVIDVRILVK
jgi:hypothetical protein